MVVVLQLVSTVAIKSMGSSGFMFKVKGKKLKVRRIKRLR